ncbi:MAG: TIGR04211 family SH3 domain-containing protein [Gammaproteobacteria bacterium]|nr:TIGR04211 family SH3 domain-containing protein [Gammaproteobacteria bacterium]
MIRLQRALLLSLVLSCGAALAEQQYISDDLTTWLHSGPTSDHRILGTVVAGDVVDVHEQAANGKFARITDSRGREGWIDSKHLTTIPSLRTRVPDLEGTVAGLQQALKARDSEIASLKGELAAINESGNNHVERLAQLEHDKAQLVSELAAKDKANELAMFERGAMVAGGGLVLGALMTLIPWRRKRDKRWM